MPESYEIPSRAKAGTRFNNDTHVDLQMGRGDLIDLNDARNLVVKTEARRAAEAAEQSPSQQILGRITSVSEYLDTIQEYEINRAA
ncbi:MAG TPA: hypothetical protein PK096_01170 [Candidatus Saccharibacteria bacterium]|nr:hypothetical protein [Candidatus Saccharibacteria bacterium]HRK93959.1 hypothetical protein [Candidatus Saccharibacteria bacterium]